MKKQHIAIYIQDGKAKLDQFGKKTQVNIGRAVTYGKNFSAPYFYTADDEVFTLGNRKTVLLERLNYYFSRHHPDLQEYNKNFRVFKTKSLYAQTRCFIHNFKKQNIDSASISCSSFFSRLIVSMLWRLYGGSITISFIKTKDRV